MIRPAYAAFSNLSALTPSSGLLRLALFVLLLASCLLCCGQGQERETIAAKTPSFDLKYGDPAPLFEAADIYGNPVDMRSLRGKTVLLEFLSPELFYDGPDFWSYSNVLAQKYKDSGFVSILILNEKKFEPSRVKRTLAEAGVELSVLLCGSEELNSLFGLQFESPAALLVDSASVVRFARPTLLDNDTKRQLVEKLVLGNISYSLESEKGSEYPFKLDHRMPDLQLERIGAEEKLTFRELTTGPRICFLFTAACTECEITKFFNALVQIRESLEGQIARENMLIIFRDDLTKQEIKKYLDDYKVGMPVYQTSDLQNLTSEYVTRKTESLRPKVILVDESGTVRYLSSLPDFKIDLQGNSVDLQIFESEDG
jgi:peroxiredoxin